LVIILSQDKKMVKQGAVGVVTPKLECPFLPKLKCPLREDIESGQTNDDECEKDNDGMGYRNTFFEDW